MAQTCMSNSIIKDTRVPNRRAYVNLNKWPEYYYSGEFPRSTTGYCGGQGQPRVIDSVSCRQLYLRSYTFTKKESVGLKTKKCFGRVRASVVTKGRGMMTATRIKSSNSSSEPEETTNQASKKIKRLRRAKELSCAALLSLFRRFMSCTTKIDVDG